MALSRDGSLILGPRNGSLYRARWQADGSYALDPRPFARLPGGRPLGMHLDKDDNLLVCNAGVVRPRRRLSRPGSSRSCAGQDGSTSVAVLCCSAGGRLSY